MIAIDCTIDADGWPDETACLLIANRAISAIGNIPEISIPVNAEVSLMFTDDQQMRELNLRWREQDRSTNVLSFAANEGNGPTTPLLGDIVLAHATIAKEAIDQGKVFEDHLAHLIVHGFLHLVGFDHIDDGQAEQMEQLEREICSSIGIADPYAAH